MPVRKKSYYTNMVENPTTDDDYTGFLYEWTGNNKTFYTSWTNGINANNENAIGYILENGIYKRKSLWNDIIGVGFQNFVSCNETSISYTVSNGNASWTQQAFRVSTPSYNGVTQKYYLPVRKTTDVPMYADDGYEGILYMWNLQTSMGTIIGTIYSPIEVGTDANWETTTVYELENDVFKHTSLWGVGGWLDNYGYGDAIYQQGKSGTSFVRLYTTGTYPQLRKTSTTYTVPVTEVTEKLYLPVRKKNGTAKYYI